MEEIRFETDCGQGETHLHEELEVLYALTGRVDVTAGDWHFVLEPEGVLVMNPFEPHQLIREAGGHTLSLYIPIGLLEQAELGRIVCCSALQPEKAVYLEILRDKLASLFLECQNPSGSGLHRMSHVFALLGVLQQGFQEGGGPHFVSGSDAAWLKEVFAFLRENLESRLTLQTAAEAFFLSPSHFSRKFQRLTGEVFSDFVRAMRLEKAQGLLAHTRRSVTEISTQCGFANPNSFIQSFQQKFGCTPGQYRRLHQGPAALEDSPMGVSYMSLTRHTHHDDRSISFSQEAEGGQFVWIHTKNKGAALRLPHNHTASAGYAGDLLLEPNQAALRRAVKEIGFRYVFFHGILNQPMNVYHADPDGTLRLNFNYVDMVLDFLTSTGAVPWVSLDSTPPELVDGEKNFFGGSCMNLPNDLERWAEVVTGLLQHMVERYGMKEVQTWRFSMEQAVYEYYGLFTVEQYEAFYLATYRAIRRVIPGAYIPGFGLDTGIVTLPGNDTLPRLLRFCRENGCLPDELSFQSFGCDYSGADLSKAEKELVDHRQDQLREPVPVSYDPNLLRHQLTAIKQTLEQNGWSGIPLSLSVMSSTIWQRDLGSDTCFKAAWIVKNILENAPALLGASVLLTEFTERSLMNPNVFHGGSGVVSFLGFPKAGYHALALLSRLRGQVIAQGDGYLATRSEDGEEVMLMLYHYCHYDRETHLDRQLPIKEQRIYDRYYGFEKKGPRSFQFILDGLAPGEYEADTHLVNRSFGSAYDIWMSMGAPERFTPDQRAYLERVAVPKYQFGRHLVDGSGRLPFSVLLEPHEVRLIHFKKK